MRIPVPSCFAADSAASRCPGSTSGREPPPLIGRAPIQPARADRLLQATCGLGLRGSLRTKSGHWFSKWCRSGRFARIIGLDRCYGQKWLQSSIHSRPRHEELLSRSHLAGSPVRVQDDLGLARRLWPVDRIHAGRVPARWSSWIFGRVWLEPFNRTKEPTMTDEMIALRTLLGKSPRPTCCAR
jgi:hypothetical protein